MRRLSCTIVCGLLVTCSCVNQNFGTVAGHSLTVKSVSGSTGQIQEGREGPAEPVLFLQLMSFPQACSATYDYLAPGGTALEITLVNPVWDGELVKGDYTIDGQATGYPSGTTPSAAALLLVQGDSCGFRPQQWEASSGRVTLDEAPGNVAAGSYSLHFGADEISGSFRIPMCGASDPPPGSWCYLP